MRRFCFLLITVVALTLCACGGGSGNTHGHAHGNYAGTFTDEFDNRFVLNDDYTGTIQFAGNDKTEEITWFDGDDHKAPFATISYNGERCYYYLRDGYLYRHREDMQNGTCAIRIDYEE